MTGGESKKLNGNVVTNPKKQISLLASQEKDHERQQFTQHRKNNLYNLDHVIPPGACYVRLPLTLRRRKLETQLYLYGEAYHPH